MVDEEKKEGRTIFEMIGIGNVSSLPFLKPYLPIVKLVAIFLIFGIVLDIFLSTNKFMIVLPLIAIAIVILKSLKKK